MKAVRVDRESPTCRLKDPLSRITYLRAPKGWMLVQTDARFVKEPKEEGRVISVGGLGAFVFFDELGSIRYYDTVVLSWVSNEKEAEFETIKFAMYEAVRIGIKKLSVCTDNFEILKAIQGGDPYPKDEFEKYRTILSFIFSEGNAVADLLAKWRMAMTRYPHTNPITNWQKVVQAAEHQYSGMPNFRIRYLKSLKARFEGKEEEVSNEDNNDTEISTVAALPDWNLSILHNSVGFVLVRLRECWFLCYHSWNKLMLFLQGEHNFNRFGEWLGKNSTMGKNLRLLKDMHVHLLASRGSGLGRTTLRVDYIAPLLKQLIDPLRVECCLRLGIQFILISDDSS
ncbi:hypothetical protein RHMOL_Rhmol13G0264300 [Rhododendron molle]|nr:hypothetical protein RHMOL_Rhmol13G0264300 [Rhododendron molle]